MTNDDDRKDSSPARTGLNTTIDSLLAGVAGVAAGSLAGHEIAAPTTVVVTSLARGGIAAIRAAAAARDKEKTNTRINTFSKLLNYVFPRMTPEEISHRITDDVDFGETVLQAYRRAIDTTDPIVLPALARLTAAYADEGKRADALFRRFGRLFQDVGSDEYEEMRGLMGILFAYCQTNRAHLALMRDGTRYVISGASRDDNASAEVKASRFSQPIMALLAHHGLATFEVGMNVAVTGQMTIDPAVYGLAWRIMGPEQPDAADTPDT